jgi:hypothetical protein
MLISNGKRMQRYLYIPLMLVALLGLSLPTQATEPPHVKSMTATLSGFVLDHSGEPLPYATVFIEGTTIGVTTDITGRYTLQLEMGDYALTASTLG